MACTDIFGILHPKPTNAACRTISENFPRCACELESIRPDLSPGTVENDECLARFIPNDPRYYNPDTGEILPNNFEWVRLRGLSTIRIEKAGSDNLHAQQHYGNYVGYLKASVKSIRDISHSESASLNDTSLSSSQVFAVYDTALDENKFHADICQSIFKDTDTTPKKERGSLNLKFRKALQEQFGTNLHNKAA